MSFVAVSVETLSFITVFFRVDVSAVFFIFAVANSIVWADQLSSIETPDQLFYFYLK